MLPGGGIGTAVLHVSEVPLGQSAHQLDVPDNNNKYYLLLLENLEARLDNGNHRDIGLVSQAPFKM